MAAPACWIARSHLSFCFCVCSACAFFQWEWTGVQWFINTSQIAGWATIQSVPAAGYASYCAANKVQDAAAWHKMMQTPADQIPKASVSAMPVDHYIEMGPGAPIQSLINWLKYQEGSCSILAGRLNDHLKRIAGHQVRNVGSIAGSMMMTRYWSV